MRSVASENRDLPQNGRVAQTHQRYVQRAERAATWPPVLQGSLLQCRVIGPDVTAQTGLYASTFRESYSDKTQNGDPTLVYSDAASRESIEPRTSPLSLVLQEKEKEKECDGAVWNGCLHGQHQL